MHALCAGLAEHFKSLRYLRCETMGALVRLIYGRADQSETTPENTFEVTIRVVSPPPPKTEKK